MFEALLKEVNMDIFAWLQTLYYCNSSNKSIKPCLPDNFLEAQQHLFCIHIDYEITQVQALAITWAVSTPWRF